MNETTGMTMTILAHFRQPGGRSRIIFVGGVDPQPQETPAGQQQQNGKDQSYDLTRRSSGSSSLA
jgi:hypothetical protein